MNVNKDLLRKKVKELGRAKVAVDAECSVTVIDKLAVGKYPSRLSLGLARRLSRALGVEMSDLFPADSEKESA